MQSDVHLPVFYIQARITFLWMIHAKPCFAVPSSDLDPDLHIPELTPSKDGSLLYIFYASFWKKNEVFVSIFFFFK